MRGRPPRLAGLKGCATPVSDTSVSGDAGVSDESGVAPPFRAASGVAQAFRAAHAVNSSSNSPPKIASTPIDRNHCAFNGAYNPYAQIRADGLRRRVLAMTGAASRVAVCIG